MRKALMHLLLILPHALVAQALLSEVRFSPPTFFVGDEVELMLRYRLETPVEVETPDFLPQADWLEIREVRADTEDGMLTVHVAFTSFAAGTRVLPPMDLGGIKLQDITIPTHSMLSVSHDGVRRLRGQLLIPGTRLAMAVILTLTAMAPFLLYRLGRFIGQWYRRFRDYFRAGRPTRRFRRLLKRLKVGIKSEAASKWYSQLTQGLRIYLSARIGRDCRSATTAEITAMGEFSADKSSWNRLLGILREGDMVKFAGRTADEENLEYALAVVESVVADWEKADAQL